MSALKTGFHKLRIQYPIALPVRYESETYGGVSGFGRTLAITTKTVTFASDQDLRVGLKIRLAILWPAKLHDGASLNLSMVGTIERCARGEVDVAVSRHEFEHAAATARRPRGPRPLL
ncbi:MAG: hypothetical protein WBY44_07435 [Bryobacteraceae bacterium]|jgi:hypothetical protein